MKKQKSQMQSIELPSVLAILAILALLAAVVLADRWVLPRFLPGPGQAWTPRDMRTATVIGLACMTASSLYVLVMFALAFR